MAGILETMVSWIFILGIILFIIYVILMVIYALYYTYIKRKNVDVTRSFEKKLIDAALLSKPSSIYDLYIQPEGYSGQKIGKIIGYTTLPSSYPDVKEEDVFVVEQFSIPVINKFPIVGSFFKKYIVLRHPSSSNFRTPIIGDITLFGSGLTKIGRFFYVTTSDMKFRRGGILGAQRDESMQESYTTLLTNMHTNVEEAMLSDPWLRKREHAKEERINLLPFVKKKQGGDGDDNEDEGRE